MDGGDKKRLMFERTFSSEPLPILENSILSCKRKRRLWLKVKMHLVADKSRQETNYVTYALKFLLLLFQWKSTLPGNDIYLGKSILSSSSFLAEKENHSIGLLILLHTLFFCSWYHSNGNKQLQCKVSTTWRRRSRIRRWRWCRGKTMKILRQPEKLHNSQKSHFYYFFNNKKEMMEFLSFFFFLQ